MIDEPQRQALTRMLYEAAVRLFETEMKDPPSAVLQGAADGEPASAFHSSLWQGLEEQGLLASLGDASQSGSDDLDESWQAGTTLLQALAPLRAAGAFAVPLPILETIIGRAALSSAGIELPTGPLAVLFEGLPSSSGGWSLPWPGELAGAVQIDAGGGVHLCRIGEAAAQVAGVGVKGAGDLVGEPRGRVADLGSLESLATGALTEPWSAELLKLTAAAGRTLLMAGAMSRILDLALEHARGRVQFGRPIAQFQAVQQMIAQLAAEVAVVDVAAETSLRSLDRALAGESTELERASFEVAAARARACEAASKVTAIGHQVHGAIGYTREHELHRFTRHLWEWRDLDGDEMYWQRSLGARAIEAGGDGLWSLLVGT